MYNNFVKPKEEGKEEKREKRKPVAENFVPKRLAVSYPFVDTVLEYMAPDSGKLYHHKMRLESKMQETFDTKQLLQYLKKKHSSYFANGNPKIKDSQVQELIQKIVAQYEEYDQEEEAPKESTKQQPLKLTKPSQIPMVKDFDFLDEEQQDNEYGKEDWDLEMGEDADIV